MTMKQKTRKERVFNESTGRYEIREVELKSYSYTDDDRLMIVRENLKPDLPAESVVTEYHIKTNLLTQITLTIEL